MFIPVAPYRYLYPTVYFSVEDIANPDLLVCYCRTWISLDIARFYEEQCLPASGKALLTFPNNGKSYSLVARGVDTVSFGVCVLCL